MCLLTEIVVIFAIQSNRHMQRGKTICIWRFLLPRIQENKIRTDTNNISGLLLYFLIFPLKIKLVLQRIQCGSNVTWYIVIFNGPSSPNIFSLLHICKQKSFRQNIFSHNNTNKIINKFKICFNKTWLLNYF